MNIPEDAYCNSCDILKPITEFWKDKTRVWTWGYNMKCRTCRSKLKKVEYEKDIVLSRAKHRARDKVLRDKDPIVFRAKQKEHRQKHYKVNKEKIQARNRLNKNPKGLSAKQRVRDAILAGKMVRGNCEVCAEPNAEGHHEDYDKPLEVRWLCRLHHRQLHTERLLIKRYSKKGIIIV